MHYRPERSSAEDLASLQAIFTALEESPVPEMAQERPLGTRKRRHQGDANTSNIQQAQYTKSARIENTGAENDLLNRLVPEGLVAPEGLVYCSAFRRLRHAQDTTR